MDPSAAGASRRRAEQFLSVAEKLLVADDLEGCKQFSSQALAADPNTPGAEDLHAASSVLLAAERRRLLNGQPDPYAILGLDPANPASRHPDAVYSHFRHLSFLLNRSRPDRPISPAFTNAARLVAEAWGFLSDSALKSALDADLNAAAAAAAARTYHSPAPNQPQSQSSLPAQPNSPFATPSPRPTPPPAAPTPRPTPSVASSPRQTPPPAAPSPRPALPRAALAPRQTPPPIALPPRPQPVVSPPRPTPSPNGPPKRSTPPAPAPQTPAATTAPPAASGTPPSSTFWTVCRACRHIHQYDRLYESCKLLCPSCRQSFVAEAMAEPPPVVPGTDMYYCTWGFFPVGFPGCPGFERLVNSQPQGPDQLNAPWLTGKAGVKGNAGDTGVKVNVADNAENGVPVGAAAEIPVEVPATTPPAKPATTPPAKLATTPPAKPMRVKVGAKKRGRPKGSKNKNIL